MCSWGDGLGCRLIKLCQERGGERVLPVACLAVEAQVYDELGDRQNLAKTLEEIRRLIREKRDSPFTKAFLKDSRGVGVWTGRKSGRQPWAASDAKAR